MSGRNSEISDLGLADNGFFMIIIRSDPNPIEQTAVDLPLSKRVFCQNRINREANPLAA